MLNSADIIDQVVKPNYNANKNGFYGILYGFFQTVIYNPYIQVDLFLLLDFINNIKNFFNPTADAELYDPLTLDLNNDGKISTLNLSNGVYFDHNKDGVAFKTSWIGKDDGIKSISLNLLNQQIMLS
ncbi:hypothetical protein [uncultured Campylobacter sp.]|uniref:hypothetical protein n=1 Tax=uncultured Campylobacter sp. TaxID=218934 RepID=UPI002616A278|nr:hypothetical protein [uncultured Campylobacter sp.]